VCVVKALSRSLLRELDLQHEIKALRKALAVGNDELLKQTCTLRYLQAKMQS
jgi:hypothetical protein